MGRTAGRPSSPADGRAGTPAGLRSRGCSSPSLLAGFTGNSCLGNVRLGRDEGSSGLTLRSTLRLLSSLLLPSAGSRIGRAGRATAPVGRDSDAPVVVLSAGIEGVGSRPLRTRVRRSSSSNGTPGVRAAAPVGRSGIWTPRVTRAGRATWLRSARSPPVPPTAALLDPNAGRKGKSPRRGSEPITRLANSSLAGRSLTLSPPSSFAGKVVTARRYAGLVRRRFLSSSGRSAVKRSTFW